MDEEPFDGWTRRRFGLAAGGLGSALVGLTGLRDDGAVARRGKRKRCKKLGQGCNPSGRRACCKKRGLACLPPIGGLGGRRCCRRGLEACQVDGDCCSGNCTDIVCVCEPTGFECSSGFDGECCSLKCVEEVGNPPICRPA
jgi:hypothetical protein